MEKNVATVTMTKPSFLGTLNAISLAESGAGVYLEAWANATQDEDLACCLRLVASRETSHGDLFCRRISELGFELQQTPDREVAAKIARYANPKISDIEKIGEDRGEQKDPFGDLERQIEDGTFDPLTAKLTTWYIAEERDSGKLLREHYARIRGGKPSMSGSNGTMTATASGPSADAQAIMECMTAGFSRIETSLGKLAKAK